MIPAARQHQSLTEHRRLRNCGPIPDFRFLTSDSRFLIEFFDFTDSLMIVPAVENQNVTITNGSHESVVILGLIAIGGQHPLSPVPESTIDPGE